MERSDRGLFKVPSQHLPGGTEGRKDLSQHRPYQVVWNIKVMSPNLQQ